ncbi:MAG: hypothetical protein HZB70_03435 [Candidatus Berkelbacteria bacterium]|nr:MAG: hypothetical protein HZB70_03435 [Candidatus Berkelbacteria bacterium]QQG51645.1 MAG: hypothetical protein HY845_03755 [Candidatus Berkelbacteria bacterium]
MKTTYLKGGQPKANGAAVTTHLSNDRELRPNRGGWYRTICGLAARDVREIPLEEAKRKLCQECQEGYLRSSDLKAHIHPFVIA